MLATRTQTLNRKRRSYATWGLVVALLITYGFGLGRHIHIPQMHALATDHLHQLEVHVGTTAELIDNVPIDHADAAWFMVELDGQSITKKTPGADFVLILLGALLLLYTLRFTNARRIPLSLVICPKHESVYSIFPPSRAPPR